MRFEKNLKELGGPDGMPRNMNTFMSRSQLRRMFVVLCLALLSLAAQDSALDGHIKTDDIILGLFGEKTCRTKRNSGCLLCDTTEIS